MQVAKLRTANVILQQLGGDRFTSMTGAKSFVGDTDSLLFAFGRGAMNGANKCKVTLVDDLYTVEFFSIRGINVKTVGYFDNIYGDKLAALFTEQTGFDTHL